ncbi:MAG: ankyrin repeat domain-containing protein [Myxococcota bacterium]
MLLEGADGGRREPSFEDGAFALVAVSYADGSTKPTCGILSRMSSVYDLLSSQPGGDVGPGDYGLTPDDPCAYLMELERDSLASLGCVLGFDASSFFNGRGPTNPYRGMLTALATELRHAWVLFAWSDERYEWALAIVDITEGLPVEPRRDDLPVSLAEAYEDGRVAGFAKVLESGESPGPGELHRALSSLSDETRVEVVALLLEAGADPNAADVAGETVLARAARNPAIGGPLVRLLLEHGARPDLAAAEAAATLGVVGVVTLLPVAEHSLRYAARNNHVDVVEHLLTRITDVDQHDFTALHGAAVEGHVEVCRLLVEAGADPGRLTAKGQSALDLAVKHERLELVQYLESVRGRRGD